MSVLHISLLDYVLSSMIDPALSVNYAESLIETLKVEGLTKEDTEYFRNSTIFFNLLFPTLIGTFLGVLTSTLIGGKILSNGRE